MRVSKNVFSFLFLLTGLASLWMGMRFFVPLYEYFQLSEAKKVEISKWEVEEIEPGKFAMIATFSFENKGIPYHKRFVFQKPMYTNPHIARDHVAGWRSESWWVWFNPHDPHQFSLQKLFPIKAGIHFLLSLAVLFYFVWLKFYIARMSQ